jgi:3',5'-cyclic AMP phosphodiesterase CpdA
MRVLLITDSHLAPTISAFNANWTAVRTFAHRVRADLTVHLGDITLDGAGDPAQYEFARTMCEDWPTPIHFVPGNHDVGDNPPGPGVTCDQPLDETQLARYRAHFGPDYWALAADGWRLVGLNTQLFGTDTATEAGQWEWLRAQACLCEVEPTAILLHKPLFQDSPADTKPHARYVPIAARRRMLDLLRPLDVRLVLSGHVHQYLDRCFDDIRHIWLPSTAFYLPDTLQERIGEKVTGVGLLELTRHGHRFDLICPDGVTRHNVLAFPVVYPPSKTAAEPTQ